MSDDRDIAAELEDALGAVEPGSVLFAGLYRRPMEVARLALDAVAEIRRLEAEVARLEGEKVKPRWFGGTEAIPPGWVLATDPNVGAADEVGG